MPGEANTLQQASIILQVDVAKEHSMAAKCPKCEQFVPMPRAESVDAAQGMARIPVLMFVCPVCNTILGTGVDPVALSEAVAQTLVRR